MTDQESNELVMYNTDFQRSVLLMMCSNIAFSVNYGLLLKQAYFDLQPLRIIFGIVCDYVLRYERELDRNNLLMLIDDYTMSKSLNKDATKVLVEECKTIFNAKISSEYFVQDQVIKFVRQAELKNAILKAIMVMEKDTSGSYEEVLRLIDEAVSIGCGVNRGVTFEDLLNLPTEYRNKYSPDKLIRTGFPRYDAAMLGGLASNEIHIIMGAPKSGKSTFGANIGAHALVGGRAIYHASLEIQELDVLKNYALRLTGMTHDEFMTCDLSYYTSKLERFRKYRPKLFVNYWPEGTINAMAIRSWISRERSQTGISPEIIIVDYDDCHSSGTRISGLDGTERPIEELVGMNEFWLYSCKDDGTLVPGRGHSARKVRDVSTMCEITLDNDEVINCTPDHRYMMRDGTYRKAKELKPGDSLMPLYRRIDKKGYEEILDNHTNKWKKTHQMVAKEVLYYQCGQIMHTDAKGLLKHIAGCNSAAAAADRLVIKDRYCKKCEQYICTDFGGMVSHAMQCDGMVEMPQVAVNHKVRSVKIIKLSRPEPVYDITVDKYHNFALSAGVFTHNCLVPTSGKTDDMYEDSGMIYRDLIQLSAYFKCCRGNTMIPLLDGTERRIDSFNKGDKLHVYSNDTNKGITIESAVALGQTSTTNSISIIELDNGEKLELTPNHKVMLKDGSYKESQYLSIGDSIMPLYRDIDEYGYETVLNNGIYQPTHRLVASQHLTPVETDQRLCVHHLDFNKRNNIPDNLEYMGDLDHFWLHSLLAQDVMTARWNDPNYRDRMIEVCRMGAKALYADPKMREKLRKQSSAIMKNLWKDSNFRNKVISRTKAMWQDPEFRAKMISSEKSSIIGHLVFKALWQDPEFRARKKVMSSEAAKKQWQDPDFAAYIKQAVSRSKKELWQDPLYQQMQERLHEEQKSDIRFKNIARNKVVRLCSQLVLSGKEINQYNYESIGGGRIGYCSWARAIEIFGSADNIMEAANTNHKIVNVNTITVKDEPMYCLYVPTTSNFAVSSGVFIHNCPLISFAQPKREAWDKPDRNELIISQDLAHCLTGNTEVLGTDGMSHRIDSFSKGDIVELYGVNAAWGIIPVKAVALGVVENVNIYYNIMLNDGTNVSCTADHKLSIADNMQFIPGKLIDSYKQAKDIKVGDTITTIDWYAHDRHLSYKTVVGTMKVHTKNEPVYCFHVQETGNFMLSNGILSSNSAKKAHKAYSISSINFPKGADRGTLLVDIARRGVSNTRIPIYRDFSRALVEEV